MLYLSIRDRDFLSWGNMANDFNGSEPKQQTPLSFKMIRAIKVGCLALSITPEQSCCSCPQRTSAPPRRDALLFQCCEENNKRMKKWLLNYLAAFTFNTCPRRTLQCMEGPPIEIHIHQNA